jgi:hypothetical protein
MKRTALFGLTVTVFALLNMSAAIALPSPDRNGDYTDTRRGNGHRDWGVVDPDPAGLNCRMAKRFYGFSLDDMNAPDELFKNRKHKIGDWQVVGKFKPGQKFQVSIGHMMAQQIILDAQGKPWMAVQTPNTDLPGELRSGEL